MRAAIGVAAALTILTATGISAGGEPSPGGRRPACVFVQQLQDEPYRTRFIEAVAEATDPVHVSAVDQMYSVIRSSREGVGVDYFSFQCLTCHDGMTGRSQQLVEKPFLSQQGIAADAHRSHPMGMFYEQVAEGSNGLRPRTLLPAEVKLVDGRVGCLSCHDPLNMEGDHLVAERDPVICLLCHQK